MSDMELPPISKHLAGKTVEACAVKEDALVVLCTDGTEVEINWADDSPRLKRVNVRIKL